VVQLAIRVCPPLEPSWPVYIHGLESGVERLGARVLSPTDLMALRAHYEGQLLTRCAAQTMGISAGRLFEGLGGAVFFEGAPPHVRRVLFLSMCWSRRR